MSTSTIPRLRAAWPNVLDEQWRKPLAQALLGFVRERRWFRAKTRAPKGASIVDVVRVGEPQLCGALVFLEIAYASGPGDLYVLTLAQAEGVSGRVASREPPIALLEGPRHAGRALIEGLSAQTVPSALLKLLADGGTLRGEHGELRGVREPAEERLAQSVGLAPTTSSGEQTNSTVSFGGSVILKLYRQVVAGPNPEAELGTFLSGHARRPPVPPVLGTLIYTSSDGTTYGVGIAHELVSNRGDAWTLAKHEFEGYLSTGKSREADTPAVGDFLPLAETLGKRTAELHLALAEVGASDSEALRPEALTVGDRATAARRVKTMLDRVLDALASRDELPPSVRDTVKELLDTKSTSRQMVQTLLTRFEETPIDALKTRIHGDLHLGQILVRGDDFVILDLEGEPGRPLAERRAKSSPLRDVVGMLRSFSYVPEAVLREAASAGDADSELVKRLKTTWTRDVAAAYRRGYLGAARGASFIPQSAEQLGLLLDFHTLERIVYEIGYELDNRPEWVVIPLAGLTAFLAQAVT